jgi:ligand-binding SRPBCC domain-containing protein
MTEIRLETIISAPKEVCFNIARSVHAHLDSLRHTNERVIAGRTSGLFELHDTVTWEAKHFGIRQRLTVQITKMQPYTFFEDAMIKGAFKSMRHEHHFEEKDGVTIMSDLFEYETPGWIFGKLFDALVLKQYMTRLLKTRNEIIRKLAENAQQ